MDEELRGVELMLVECAGEATSSRPKEECHHGLPPFLDRVHPYTARTLQISTLEFETYSHVTL